MRKLPRLLPVFACIAALMLAADALHPEKLPELPPNTPDPAKPIVPSIWRRLPGKPGSWHDRENWSGGVPDREKLKGGVPGNPKAYIDNGGIAQLSADALSLADVYVGEFHSGTVQHIDGRHTISALRVGVGRISVGDYNLSDSGEMSASEEYIGIAGKGLFNQDGGVNRISGNLYLGYRGGSEGTYILGDDAELFVGSVYVGGEGTGVFDHTGGTNVVRDTVRIGDSKQGGTYNLGGEGILKVKNLHLGGKGTGRFNQTGGTNLVDTLRIESRGEYVLQRGTLKVKKLIIGRGSSLDIDVRMASFEVSGNETASLNRYIKEEILIDSTFDNQSGISVSYDEDTDLTTLAPVETTAKSSVHRTTWKREPGKPGYWHNHGNWTASVPGSKSIAVIDNGGTTLIDSRTATSYLLQVGGKLLSTIEHTDSENRTEILCLGEEGEPGEPGGRYNLSNQGKLSARVEYVGHGGQGEFNQYSCVNALTSALYVGYRGGSVGIYNLLDKGKLLVEKAVCVGGHGKADFNQAGGTCKVGVALYIGSTTHYGACNLGGDGELEVSVATYVGSPGVGKFGHSDGSHSVCALYVGEREGVYNLNGEGELSVKHAMYVGYTSGKGKSKGKGVFNHTGGTNIVGGPLYIGVQKSGGTYNLSGGGKVVARSIYLGTGRIGGGAGRFVQASGATSVGSLFIKKGSFFILKRGTLSAMSLRIEGGGVLDIDARRVSFKVLGDKAALLNGYIKEGRLIDSTLGNQSGISASYDENTGLTTLAMAATMAKASSYITTWKRISGQPGYWHTDNNWTARAPDSTSTAVICNGGTALITKEVAKSYLTLVGGRSPSTIEHTDKEIRTEILCLGEKSGTGGVYNLSNKGAVLARVEYVGHKGRGEFNHNGGNNKVKTALYLGYWPDAHGTYNLNGGGGLSVGHTFYVGDRGSGLVRQSGGTGKVGIALYVGGPESGSAYNLGGEGELSVEKAMYVGRYNTGRFSQTGGTGKVGIALYVGGPQSGGTCDLIGESELSVGTAAYVGCMGEGTAVFNQIGGKNEVGDVLYISGPKLDATYNLSGDGELSVEHAIYVGRNDKDAGRGVFNHISGTNKAEFLYIRNSGRYLLKSGTLAVRHIKIYEGGSLDIDIGDMTSFKVSGNKAGLLNDHIKEGRIFDSTLRYRNTLYAVYDPENDCTTLKLHVTSSRPAEYNKRITIWKHIPETPGSWNSHLNWTARISDDRQTAVIENGGTAQIKDQVHSYRLRVGGELPGVIEHIKRKNSTENLHLGCKSGTAGTYNLGDSGELLAEQEYIGDRGKGIFNHNGGTNTVANALFVGYGSGSEGIYSLSGKGKLSVENALFIGCKGTGTFNQDGAANMACGVLCIGGSESTGKYVFAGGSLEADSLEISKEGALDIHLGKITSFKIAGNTAAKLNALIADGRIYDSTLEDSRAIEAVYDSKNDCTTLKATQR